MTATKKVVIVGAGSGYDSVREYEKDKEYEIWCTPSIYPVLTSRRVDRVFEVHAPTKWSAGVDYKKLGKKLVVPRTLSEIPDATILPVEALQSTYGMMFSSSIAWMTGYALSLHATEIVYLGVDMQDSYSGQRDGLFYLLGFAKAMGTTVTIPNNSRINIFGKSYGWT